MKIMIIGAGIGGLTTAVALRKKGISCDVFEAAPELNPVGAGIWMAPNALTVLHRLGIAETIKKSGNLLNGAIIADQSGRTISVMDGEQMQKRYGQPLCAIHRARLQQVLLEQIASENIHLGKRLLHLEQTASGIRAVFEDGSSAEGDLLIGADGIRSAVRQNLFGEMPLRYSGQICWRGVAHLQLPDEFRANGHEIWGKRAGHRFGFSQIFENEVYWYLTLKASNKEGPLYRYAELAAPFPPVVQAIVARTEPSRVIFSELFDLLPIPHWHKGRAVLLGDAAHAMTPNLGQGGCQAIEDGWVLADCLAKNASDPEAAFVNYYKTRRARVNKIVSASGRLGQMTNLSGVRATFRNALLRLMPDFVMRRQSDFLYKI